MLASEKMNQMECREEHKRRATESLNEYAVNVGMQPCVIEVFKCLEKDC